MEKNIEGYNKSEKPFFLMSGEFHYFRVPRDEWRRRLELFKETGGNCVATYVPWCLHEPVEGQLLFGDVPERDLEGFLKLCKELLLQVIVRPGPYQFSELKYHGLPKWLCEGYPQLRAKDREDKPFHAASLSYIHPLFLQKTKEYFKGVCRILSGYTADNGGPIASVQVDNELMGVHLWFSGCDYNEEGMGIGKEHGKYPEFLKKRYGAIEILNKAYDSAYLSFTDVRPLNVSPKSVVEILRAKDYHEFYFSTCADYIEILAALIKEEGINCNIVHNSANPDMNAYFLDTVKRMKGKNFLLGSDHYYNLDLNWNQNNPTPQYAAKIFYSNEMLRLMGFPPTIFELPGGSCADWPPIEAEDLSCCYYTNLAFGMKGFNAYVFAGGQTPFDIGHLGDNYDFQAPVSSNGEIKPHYYTLKKFMEFINKNQWLYEAERICDINVGLDFNHARSRYYFNSNDIYGTNNWDAFNFMREGMMITAMCASYSPNLIDMDSCDIKNFVDKPLLVASSISMSESIQRNLISFVEAGGRLLIAPVIPAVDENLKECTLLMKFLGCHEVTKSKTLYPLVSGLDVRRASVGQAWCCDSKPSEAETIIIDEFTGEVRGWNRVYPFGGQVIWYGAQWNYSRYEQRDLLKNLINELGCDKPIVKCSNSNLWTSLRSNGDSSMLFIMNLYSSPMETDIELYDQGGIYKKLGNFRLKPMEVKTVMV